MVRRASAYTSYLYGKDKYLEMEILDGTINVFHIDAEGGEEQRTICYDESLVNSIAEEFYDRAV